MTDHKRTAWGSRECSRFTADGSRWI